MKHKLYKILSVVLALMILFSSCASSTMIQSVPPQAKLYIDGEPVGTTPYQHRDTKIVGSTTTVRLEKEGYQPYYTSFSRDEEVDVGAIIGGVFFWFPFLWTMKYKPTHTYEMIPIQDTDSNSLENSTTITNTASKADEIRELKKLLDEGLITKEEYQKEKEEILNK